MSTDKRTNWRYYKLYVPKRTFHLFDQLISIAKDERYVPPERSTSGFQFSGLTQLVLEGLIRVLESRRHLKSRHDVINDRRRLIREFLGDSFDNEQGKI